MAVSVVITRCATCGQRNRIVPAVKTKGLLCGNKLCRDPLPTPAIVDRLTGVKDELTRVDREFTRFGSRTKQAALENAFRRQDKILKSLPDFPGYKTTVRASRELVWDIELLAEGLQKKLDSSLYAIARRALDALVDFFKSGSGPAALLRGFSDM